MTHKIATTETGFFRNEPQLEVFEERLLPGMLQARAKSKRLRIWSAACSAGEDAYTLAILIHRTLGVRIADWRIEILGTDVSEAALRTGADGRYTERSLQCTSAFVRSRYFRREGEAWVIDDTIRTMVALETQDLRDRLAASRHATWDVIFCRDILASFDASTRAHVLGTFGSLLADDGYLLIGRNESIRAGESVFEPIAPARACGYAKSEPFQ